MSAQKDISSILISEQAIQYILPSILVDAIVMDEGYKIIAASQNVLDYIGYTNDELKHQHINILAGGRDMQRLLETSLLPGYFFEKRTRLLSKNKKWVAVEITGFYLGLISDLNGSIILKVKNLEEIDRINEQLLLKKVELDDFIYRTSHDLRGPLATIRGLVNLVRVRKTDEELDTLVPMLVERTEKLDERLSQLLYLTQAEREVHEPRHVIDFRTLDKALRDAASQNALPSFVRLQIAAPEETLLGVNEVLIQSLVINLLQHVLSLPLSRLDSLVSIAFRIEGNTLGVVVAADGFKVSGELHEALARNEFIYSDILNFPRLVNYFSAKKIALGLQCNLMVKIVAEDHHELSFLAPIKAYEGTVVASDTQLEMYE